MKFLGLPVSAAISYGALFAVAFCVYSLLWPSAPIMSPDSYGYVTVAQDLSDLTINRLHARPPGYPLFLALTGSAQSPGPVLFYLSVALHFAAIWMLALVLCHLGITGRPLIGFALVLLLPPYVEFAAYVLTETLSEFLLVVSFSSVLLWFLGGQKPSVLIVAGIGMAYGGLTRPTYQILALVVSAFLLMFRLLAGRKPLCNYSWRNACAILILPSIVLIGGYSLVNYSKFKFFGIYPMAGFNLTNLTAMFVEQLPDQYKAEREALVRARDAQLISVGGDHTGNDYVWHALPDLAKITGLAPIPDLSQYLLRLNFILIEKAPLHYFYAVLKSFTGYWLPSATRLANMNSTKIQVLWVTLHFVILGLFLLQFVVITGMGLFQISQSFFGGETCISISTPQIFAYSLVATILFFNAIASAIGGTPDSRYRVPTEPLLIFMCFLGFSVWYKNIGQRTIV